VSCASADMQREN